MKIFNSFKEASLYVRVNSLAPCGVLVRGDEGIERYDFPRFSHIPAMFQGSMRAQL